MVDDFKVSIHITYLFVNSYVTSECVPTRSTVRNILIFKSSGLHTTTNLPI